MLRAVLVAAIAVSALGAAAPAQADSCRRAKNEPPCNPALPDSPWGVSHRNSYAQASSPYPGIAPGARVRTQHIELPGIPIQLQFTNRYRDGGRAVWGSLVSVPDARGVFKVDHRTGRLIDLYLPRERERNPPPESVGGITGSYNLLDRQGRFFVPREREIEVFSDARRGRRFSRIRLVKRFRLPARAFCRADDRLVGATMTYDGRIAFATEQGVTGVIPRVPRRMTAGNLRAVSFNGDRCADPAVPADQLEQVSNSIAADEDGGIYVVTSRRMRRVDWDAQRRRLRLSWSAPYETTGSESGIRLGAGSGSTPTLMGTGRRRDRFVVITDAQELMHVVLFWRDRIPRGWRPIAPGKSRRIACELPVRFGDPDATRSVSEQSVLVRGYATVHVQNQLRDESFLEGTVDPLRNALAALSGGDPALAPHGVERIDWDPRRRRCRSVWANRRASIPNAIPSMSSATGLFYGIGQRDGFWGVEGLDFRTGRNRLFARASTRPCSERALSRLSDVSRPLLAPILERLPRSCENSFYAATEVGPDRTIYTGTFLGMSIYRTAQPHRRAAPRRPLPCRC